MEINTDTYGDRTDVYHVETGEYLGFVWHESSDFYSAGGYTFKLLADAVEHIANLLPNRVRAGALIMDSTKPGWADMIDVDKLYMDDIEKCIIGQAFKVKEYDAWQNAKAELNLDKGADAGVRHGFDNLEGAWDTLKALWVNEIEKRKS